LNRFVAIVAVVGAFVVPAAVVVASTSQPVAITLAPAFALVGPNQHVADFLVVNTGTQSVHVAVRSTDGWVIPDELTFDIPPNQRHDMTAAVRIPSNPEPGDHETRVVFSVPPTSGTGTLNVTQAVASRVLIQVGGTAVRDLHIFGLSVPMIADSFDAPDINLTVANHGNVHEIVTIAPFGQTLVLRDSSKVLDLQWSRHPFLGPGTVTAAGQSATTWFLPWRILGGLLALFCGVWLSVVVNRSRKEVQP
jgi:hypothetical protein